MTILHSELRLDEQFEKRRAHWLGALAKLAAEEAALREGGGARAQAKQREQGKLSARERVAALCDPGAPFVEIGLWAAYGMYGEWGGAPGAGVVAGVGRIQGREAMVVADDRAGWRLPARSAARSR